MRSRYGDSPLHLAAQLAVLGVTAYAVTQVVRRGAAVNFLGWLLAGPPLHDLLLLPLYALVDAVLRRLPARNGVPVVNHMRIPLLISGLLLLCFFPLVLDRAPGNYRRSTAHPPSGYGRDWALITLALLTASAGIYALRVKRATRAADADARRPSTPPSPGAPAP
jgi:hypothetical protein